MAALCPSCGTGVASIGLACATIACSRLGIHAVPTAYARRTAGSAGPLDPFVGRRMAGVLVAGFNRTHAYGDEYIAFQPRRPRPVGLLVLRPPPLVAPGVSVEAPQSTGEELGATFARYELVDHPAVARPLRHGVTDDGHPWMVTSSPVRGAPIGSALAPALDGDELMGVFDDLCSALTAIHSAGQSLGTLGERSIWVRKSGGAGVDVDLADAGLALFAAHHGVPATTSASTRLLAPEQLNGTAIGPWTDVYALASWLLQTMTGQPFGNPSALVDISHRAAAMWGPTTDLASRANLSLGLLSIMLSALARSTRDRFGSVAALQAALSVERESLITAWESGPGRDFG